MTFKLAAQKAGVSERTLHSWRTRGLNGEEPFLTFFRKFERAEALHAEEALKVLAGTEEKPMTSEDAKWLLSHRHSNHFAPKQQVDVNVSGTIEHVHVAGMSSLNLDELTRLVELARLLPVPSVQVGVAAESSSPQRTMEAVEAEFVTVSRMIEEK